MNSYVAKFAPALVLISCATAGLADTPKPTPEQAKANLEAKVLATAQAKCAEKEQVALGQHVYGTYMIKCVSPDDPAYKAQQAAQAAH